MTRDRHLVLDGVHNLRDLGGYPAGDGRVTRWGRLFRADALHRLSADDLTPWGVRTVVDLRAPDDPQKRPFESPGVETIEIAIAQGSVRSMLREAAGSSAETLAGMYLDLARESGPALGAVLAHVATEERLPLLFHCTMGKDRTGVVAGVLLSLLGVPDDVIAEDYSLTTKATEALVASLVEENPAAAKAMTSIPAAMWESPAEAMVLFLQGLRDEHGSVEAYAVRAGVDEATQSTLRELLLERL